MNRMLLGLAASLTLIPAATASALTAGPNASYAGASGDGSHVYYLTSAAHVPGDVNHETDLYVRAGGQSALVSTGTDSEPALGLAGVSHDGSVVAFASAGRLVAEDTDDSDDVYVRLPGGLRKITPGNTAGEEELGGLSADGSRAWITTSVALDPADADGGHPDVYEIATATGAATLISKGTTAAYAAFAGASADGLRVFFNTFEPVVAGDTDLYNDVYVAEAGVVALATPGTDGAHVFAHAISTTGDRVVFQSTEALDAADTDTLTDVYEAGPGGIVLRSPSPNAAGAAKAALLEAASADATRVVFRTTEALTGGDADAGTDLYTHQGSTLALLSGNQPHEVQFAAASSNAAAVLFTTVGKLAGTDTDASRDLYRASSTGVVTHVNPTNGAFDVSSAASISPNGNVIAFDTAEPFAAGDGDDLADTFVRAPSVKLASARIAESEAGPIGPSKLRAVTGAGVAVFETTERLVAEDINNQQDVYAFLGSQITLVSPDTVAPDTMLTAPATALPDAPIHTTVSSTEIGGLQCSVDGGAWTMCAGDTTFDGLPAGTHTLRARATDYAGNVDQTPAEATVAVSAPQVDAPPPVVSSQSPTQAAATPDTTAPQIGQARVARKRSRLAVAFVMGEVATVRILVERKVGGRWKKAKARTIAGHLGRHTVVLRVKRLRPGMRVRITARDAAGNRARPAKVRIRQEGVRYP